MSGSSPDSKKARLLILAHLPKVKDLPAKFKEGAQCASFGECAPKPFSVIVNFSEMGI